jgi:hypothetical protein
MNTNTMKMMIAAAALVVAAGSASAQTFKAEVPVTFRVGNKAMAPGIYDVRLTKGTAGQILVVHNQSDNSAVVLVGAVGDSTKASRDATVTFECTDGSCSLRKLSDGSGATCLFPAQRTPGTITAHRTDFVTLSMIKAH